ncbi:MAG: UbiA family prenyltransferase [Gammaproteobacteria bacterium]|jgi:1,4-dihydroxy-2-naphthoate octaprenyltransferase|nr:UbiA family prenyltransferase [Gammaproteobacteria bacterium]
MVYPVFHGDSSSSFNILGNETTPPPGRPGAGEDAVVDRLIESVLGKARRMFLATSVAGNSSGSSVFFARDGDELVFFTFNPSRKAEQIRVNPNVQAVVWPDGEEGIRGLQIQGRCQRIRDKHEVQRAREAILAVTDAFRSFMDDPFLVANNVVGYYRLRPVTTKYVDFHDDPKFRWREYPQNRVPMLREMAGAIGRSLLLWIRALRAPFFTATLVPVGLGAVIAAGELKTQGLGFDWGLFWLVLFGALCAHAGTNLGNDYGDHLSRNDELNKVPSPFNGGSRVIQAGLIAPWKILLATVVCFLTCIAIGLHLNAVLGGAWLAPTPLLWVGMAGVVLGIAYTLGPVRLGYRGLGEPAIAIGFGPVIVLGTHYVLTAGRLDSWSWLEPLLASVPVAIFVMLIVWINQFQDVPADRAVGKNNWVVRLARAGAGVDYTRPLALYRVFLAAGFVAVAALGLGGWAGWFGTGWAFIALLPVVLAWYGMRMASDWHRRSREPGVDWQRLPYDLLKVNALTIGLHLAVGLLLIVAYAPLRT